ncbi:ATP-dependent DNA helicase DinG (plasmid) [Moellerella wisconsensis]|uniref:ATP-dependent DNA helicase DinG n=1 Tax=Moellerella wisconsensis TaxID=158849 RepID=A0ACD3YC34_9GAMM|nr:MULTISPECIES: ATP-dependent DNA helicase DinG [Morganellaceae]QCJ72203.1 ATP-dependent DNA helicase DinG [Providencia heimbachae]UNH40621.1 ATP-dependent DNA helicase DinG [Moellerella wisconsensis]UNH44325.1 ATP-dependent DNA helicase DinG [Moellerella wisconsensis]
MSNKNKLTAEQQTSIAYSNFLTSKGLKPRAGQQEMIHFCSSLINDIPKDNDKPVVGVVEAGTGTGKTLGYCLPLIPLAKEKGKTLILSTATVALQEQVVVKDLPEIQSQGGLKFTYAMAKGRGRYFCRLRYDAHVDAELNAYGDVRDDMNSLGAEFQSGEWTGERDTYPLELTDKSWNKVNAVASQCPKVKCPHYKSCPFFAARSRLEEVDVVIANHDIVLSDLSLGGGVILPVPKEAIYIFDEGHHLTSKAIEHFAANASLDNTARWLGEVSDMVMDMQTPYGEKMNDHVYKLVGLASDTATELMSVRGTLLSSLSFRNDHGSIDVYRFPEGDVPADVRSLFKNGIYLANQMQILVEKMTTIIDEAGDKVQADENARHKMAIGDLKNRLENLLDALKRFSAPTRKGDSTVPVARWVNIKRDNKSEVIIHSSPVHAGEHLNRELWQEAHGVIITSATLRTMGNFDAYLNEAGLEKDTPTLLAKSPFDYENNGVLFVPKMRSTPKNAEAHTNELIELLPKLVLRRKGCLVLFSSRKQMTEVCAGMPEDVKECILMQTTMPKSEIVSRHKLRIDRGEPSIIFGMASFSEGVDLPGDYCDNVIIAKLPFSVPSDPVSQTMTEWMEKAGRNTFEEITVPQACIKLIQAVGRLIRTESDTGAVTILDSRIKNTRYGQSILDSLPPFRRVIR